MSILRFLRFWPDSTSIYSGYRPVVVLNVYERGIVSKNDCHILHIRKSRKKRKKAKSKINIIAPLDTWSLSDYNPRSKRKNAVIRDAKKKNIDKQRNPIFKKRGYGRNKTRKRKYNDETTKENKSMGRITSEQQSRVSWTSTIYCHSFPRTPHRPIKTDNREMMHSASAWKTHAAEIYLTNER